MDFWDVTKLFFRRWYIGLPLLLASVVATGYTSETVTPDFVLSSYIQLIPPTSDTQAGQTNTAPRNPWSVLGLSSLSQASIYATEDQTFLDQLSAEGDSINFSITTGYPSPIVTVEVVGQTLYQVNHTTDQILQRFQATLVSLQTQYGVRPADMITTHRLDQGENVKRPGGKVKRAIVAIAGVGLLITIAVTIGVDVVLRRRAATGAPAGPGVNGSVNGSGGHGAYASSPARGREQAPALSPDGAGDTVKVGAGDRRHADGADPDDGRDGSHRSLDGAETFPLPADATVVLPLKWPGGKDGTRR